MGLEREGGNNAAVEGSLNAPQTGGGRASRRAAAAEVVEKTGMSFLCALTCVNSFLSSDFHSKLLVAAVRTLCSKLLIRLLVQSLSSPAVARYSGASFRTEAHSVDLISR